MGVELGISGEDEASVRDSATVAGVAGMRYVEGKDLALSFGIAVQSRLEDDAWIWPYFALDWRLFDDVHLVSHGSDLGLEAHFGDAWTLSCGAEFEMRQYRLNDKSPISSGVVQDDQIMIAAGLSRKPSAKTTFVLRGGTTIWRELEFLDDGGNSVGEFETDAAPFASFELRSLPERQLALGHPRPRLAPFARSSLRTSPQPDRRTGMNRIRLISAVG